MNDDFTVNGQPDPLDFNAPSGDPPEQQQQQQQQQPADKGDPWAAIESLTTLVTGVSKSVEQLAARGASPTTTPEPQRREESAPAGFPQPNANPLLVELNSRIASGMVRSQADLEKFWDDQFIANPGRAMVAQQQLTQLQTAQATSAANAPVQEQQGLAILEEFRRSQLTNPMFLNPEVRRVFDGLIEQERSAGSFRTMRPDQIRQGLEHVFKMAVGEVAMTRATGSSADERSARANRPPLYPVGSGSGGFGSSGSARGGDGGGVDMRPRNETERELIESGRTYKMKPEDIAEALHALRSEESA